MKRIVLAFGVLSLVVICFDSASAQAVTPVWYTFKFSEADLWNYDPGYDSSATSAALQSAPRRHHDVWKSSGITSTWLYGDGAPAGTEGGTVDTNYQHTAATAGDTGFGGWAASAAGQSYAITGFNLWGADFGNAVNLFGEKFLSKADASDNGVSSWQVVSAPAGWVGSISNEPSWTDTRSWARWDTTGAGITQANADPNAFFEFRVLIENPDVAFESDGSLRVWFGEYKDSGDGLDGVMQLQQPVPEPATLVIWSVLGVLGVTLGWWRRRRAA